MIANPNQLGFELMAGDARVRMPGGSPIPFRGMPGLQPPTRRIHAATDREPDRFARAFTSDDAPTTLRVVAIVAHGSGKVHVELTPATRSVELAAEGSAPIRSARHVWRPYKNRADERLVA